MQKLWSWLSFQDWNENWIGALGHGKDRALPRKLASQFKNLEDYFLAQAITLQEIGNAKVNGFFDKFEPSALQSSVKECLRRYIYYGVDGLLYNCQIAEEQTVSMQTSSVNGSTTIASGYNAVSSMDFLSTKAVDNWNLSGIETKYKLWLKQNNYNDDAPLLDIKQFYTKNEIDTIVAQLEVENQLISERITKEVEQLDRNVQGNFDHLNKYKVDYSNATRVNDTTKGDHKLIRNLTFTGSLEKTTFSDTGIKVEDGTPLYDAEIYTSTDVAHLDAIVVDNISEAIADNPATQASSFRLVKEHHDTILTQGTEIDKLNDFINSYGYWIPGEYKWMPPGSGMPKGWIKVALEIGTTLISGTEEGLTSGAVKNHKHRLYDDDYLSVPAAYYYGQNGYDIRVDAGTVSSAHAPMVVSGGWTEVDHTGMEGVANNLAAGMYAELWQYDPEGKFQKQKIQDPEMSLNEINKLSVELSTANIAQKTTLLEKIIDFNDAKKAIIELQTEIKSIREKEFSGTENEKNDKKIAELENMIVNLNQYKEYMLATPYGQTNFEVWLKEWGKNGR